jgi:Flp pilus assembly protein TadG
MSRLTVALAARVAPIVERVKNEPVAAATGASLALGLAASFGLPITSDQKLELGGALVAAANWWARSKSVSTNKLVSGDVSQSAAGQPVTIVSPDGATTTVGGTTP